MKKFLLVVYGFAFFAWIVGCATPPPLYKPLSQDTQLQRELMIGSWYGERTTDRGKTMWIVERGADSRLSVRFRYPSATGRGYEEAHEVGYWGVSGPIYFTMTRGWLHGDRFEPADPQDANFYDAYEIISLDVASMRYRSLEVGSEYEIRKVSHDFEFPE